MLILIVKLQLNKNLSFYLAEVIQVHFTREKLIYSKRTGPKGLEKELISLKNEKEKKSNEIQNILSKIRIREGERDKLNLKFRDAKKEIKGGFLLNLFKPAEKKKSVAKKELIEQKKPEKEKKKIKLSKRLKKCYFLLDKTHEYLKNNKIEKAKKMYAICREQYIKLSDEEKAQIYEQLRELYTLTKR